MHIVTEKERGFSLVELAIVIVIIGLLAAGIMGGSHIMHTSQLQQVGTEVDKYKMGIRTFEQKYGAMPGDFDTAFDLWGTAGGCTDNDVNSDPTGCNGNGDGIVAWDTEGYRAWQQLGLSEILTGDFSGTSTGNEAVIGDNVPEAAVEGGGYSFVNAAIADTSVAADNRLALGGAMTASWAGGALLTPEDAMVIDQKFDDGYPDSGDIYGEQDGTTGACATGADPNLEYDTSIDAVRCRLQFNL